MHRVSAEILFHIRTPSFRTHRLSQWGTYYLLKIQNNQHNLPKAKRHYEYLLSLYKIHSIEYNSLSCDRSSLMTQPIT